MMRETCAEGNAEITRTVRRGIASAATKFTENTVAGIELVRKIHEQQGSTIIEQDKTKKQGVTITHVPGRS